MKSNGAEILWQIARKVFRVDSKKSSAAIHKMRRNKDLILQCLAFLATFWAMQKVAKGFK